MVNNLTIVNTFFLIILHFNIKHSAIITRRTTKKLSKLKCTGSGKKHSNENYHKKTLINFFPKISPIRENWINKSILYFAAKSKKRRSNSKIIHIFVSFPLF